MAVETKATARAASGRLTRRAVLGAALAGGVGIAAARLLAAEHSVPVQPGTRTDWASPLGSESARVQHLLRRAAFGATAEELERALSDGFKKTVDRLVETKPATPPPLAAAEDATRLSRLNPRLLQQWWLDWMLATPTPFVERMTFFWHGHFTSDFRKVGLQTPWIYWQNQTWRANAVGDFREFLYQVTIDPAMLRYLDLATSTAVSPNENYSRELMELFTMGPGNYSEDDVRASAKALAGWRLPRAGEGQTGIFEPRRAYGGTVTFLGKAARFDTRAVLDRILAQKATAPFVVTKLLSHFALPNPPTATVGRLASSFVRSRWSIRQLMHDVLTSAEFTSAAAYRSLVKTPTELMVGALKALAARDSNPAVAAAAGMGQVLFDPPDVGGWPTNEAWISSNTVVERINFVSALLGAVSTLPSPSDAVKRHLDATLSPATAAAFNAARSDRERWFLVLASPEYQLK
jgi:uncharacterized protein (DUF1800 family)